jgi:hypothetical protein
VRTTIDLPADLHQAVTSIAAHRRQTLNQTVEELIRRGLAHAPIAAYATARSGVGVHKRTGLPTIRSPRPMTEDDVRALDEA